MQSFIQNQKKKKVLRTEIALLGLWAGIFKNDCHICDQRPPISLIAKFHGCLICVFWRATLEIYCHFCNHHPIIGLIAKFGAETKILKFRTKNA